MHMNETSNSDKIIETLSGDRNWGGFAATGR